MNMSRALHAVIVIALAATVAACNDHAEQHGSADTVRGQWLAGIWDARFVLDVSLDEHDSAIGPVRGRMALLPNRWLDGTYPGIDSPTDYGTYDVDFTAFGIEPRARGETPTVIAGWTGKDSVQIVLTSVVPSLSLVLHGRAAGDSIAGRWDYTVSRASGGGGRFVMRRALPLGMHQRVVH
jgi:hypothetical protein